MVDTSAVLHALAHRPAHPALLARLRDQELAAPHVIDLELLQALRGLVRGRQITPEQAEDVRADFGVLSITRYVHGGLVDRIWELRPNLTAYDAAYVALAEILDCPLVTSDAGMAKASGHRADVELYGQP
ncbi:MAG TPA: type II toxin-antitoxin system VapC family toxin [Mycobacteriales bacterium]|nr:type II toxin-antitoxin system VapC family toxin [Mycobacteriales bacterium]